MDTKDIQKQKLPDTPGVYLFKSARKVLYIGKATSLRSRVRSYFTRDIREVRSPIIEKMVNEAKRVDYRETDSVLEALILEANLIKKHQPLYNSREKDDKSFNYVLITHEAFPRVLTVRGKDLKSVLQTLEEKELFGPYPQGKQFKEAMKIIRKIFPYFDTKYPVTEAHTKTRKKQIAFNQSIGVFPGILGEMPDRKEYSRTIRHITLFLRGKKKELLSQLAREMKAYAKAEEFEKAQMIKRRIFALMHIRDVSLIKEESRLLKEGRTFRIEAYDVAHTSGKEVVGVMSVVTDGEVDVQEYRKFKISKDTNNDIAGLREMLLRRLAHGEWEYPRLIVVDGGKAQVNAADKILKDNEFAIPVIGVVKDEHHKPKGFVGEKRFLKEYEKAILLANSEAHRFALRFHRKRRQKF